jgi:hypothetical protein
LGEEVPEPILDKPEKAPERFGFLANELPDFLSSKGQKGVSAGRIVAFNTVCIKYQKTLIEQLQEEVNVLKKEVKQLRKAA